MADQNDVQALERISSEIDETQIKITLSSQCIKAQAFLFDKLRKQSERQREICTIVSKGNLKIEEEIKQAELEINSLIIAHETIKSANIELKKECLLAQAKKQEVKERIIEGERKYENLWLECKSRYETIPIIKKLIQSTNKAHQIKENIITLENETEQLTREIEAKKKSILNLDRLRIIEFAKFFIEEAPKIEKEIVEKSNEVRQLEQDIKNILKEQENITNKDVTSTKVIEKTEGEQYEENKLISFDVNWPNLSNTNETLRMPSLQLNHTDLDDLNAKLDEIKIKKTELIQSNAPKRINSTIIESEIITSKRIKKDEGNYSYYFNRPVEDNVTCMTEDSKINDFSKRKLINILEDIKIDKDVTYNIISKVNPEKLKDVVVIGSDNRNDIEELNKDKKYLEVEKEQIEEIDLTNTHIKNLTENIIGPPTQFLDLSQESCLRSSQQPVEVLVQISVPSNSDNINSSLKNTQDETAKKSISFDLPVTAENEIYIDDDIEVNEVDQTINSQLNTSVESYTKLKEMILKKHNLDSSPQFVYARNTVLQMRNEEKVTSKFFQQCNIVSDVNVNKNKDVQTVNTVGDKTGVNNEKDCLEQIQDTEENGENLITTQVSEMEDNEKGVTGFLFSHGPQGIPDSLNMSISTTGFEEGEDFPHCLDASLLLSPKADMPVSGNNVEVLSQEAPNFLSGLRKTAFSFFGSPGTIELKNQPQTSTQNQQNNFSFHFGDEEKKNRGGLFSMFH